MSRILSVALLALMVLAAFTGFRLLEAGIAAEVYRARLAELAGDYERLRGQYDEAVRRTAVTELVVSDGRLSVVIRTAEGDLETLASPFDPSREIYIDYVVRDGRLWIRRLFDDQTAPGAGMVIDPSLYTIDWEAVADGHGKALYRALGEGRWIVDVSGDGSLGLRRRADGEAIELVSAPQVRDYAPIDAVVGDALAAIGPIEALVALVRQIERGAGGR
jgi:hypothetical protein